MAPRGLGLGRRHSHRHRTEGRRRIIHRSLVLLWQVLWWKVLGVDVLSRRRIELGRPLGRECLDVHTVEDAHGSDVLRRVGSLTRAEIYDGGLVVTGGLPHGARRGTPLPRSRTQAHGRGTSQATSPPALVAPHLLGGTLALHLWGCCLWIGLLRRSLLHLLGP